MLPRTTSSLAIITAAVLVAFSTAASAFGFIDSFHGGTQLSGAGVVSAATGGARATCISDPFVIFLNPAGLSAIEGFSASVSGGVLGWKEIHRYGIERNLRSDRIFGMRCASAAYPVCEWLVAAGGFAAVADADYEGSRYLLSDMSGQIYGQEILFASGTQWDAVAGLAAEPLDGLSIGVSAGYRTGEVDLEYYRYDNWLGVYDSLMLDTLEIGEPAVRMGIMKRSQLATLGVCYSAGGEYLAPVISGGFSVIAPHIQNVRVGLEGDLFSPLGRNDYAGRLQIEYPLDPSTGILAGVSFSDYPSETGSGMGLSLGGTRLMGKLRIETAMHWQTSQVFGSYIEGEDADRVDASTTEFILGMTLLP